ncbi:hypothetical protein [Phytomonospora endophytica]|uniref:Uncharacterized protein n=1 Tax=Phytomonospora endophytica TaxID=714109 RepID=A0A841FSF1_9ACTN|nr:hypothetical protein [Phytomonospora endophytica]MBB6036678.1 hypothetical protein [Phytomonospora endophytica]GIG66000.1 hypothetical protein Pen01_22950 [Phytomonospora endophytica]
MSAIPTPLRVRRWVSLAVSVALAALLAWPLVDGLDVGPFAPERPNLDGTAALPPGGTAVATIGPEGPATVTATMPAGWYVEDGTASYAGGDATITLTAFRLAPGFTAADAEARETIATMTTRSVWWRLGPVRHHSYGGFQVVDMAVSSEPDAWEGIDGYVFLDATVVHVNCVFSDEDAQEEAVAGCATALRSLRVAV